MNEQDEKLRTKDRVSLSLSPTANQRLVPKPPENLAEAADREVQAEVEALTATIRESLDDRQFMMTLDNLGRVEQDLANKQIGIIETRVNSMAKIEGPGEKIPEVVNEMRTVIDSMNPKRTEQSWVASIISALPGGNNILDFWWESGLRQIIRRRETIREQIREIRQGLLGNKQQLTEDSTNLNQLYNYVQDGALAKLQLMAYTCELLLQKFQEIHDGLTPDDSKKARVHRVIEAITVRVRHMRMTENALGQGLTTIDITTDGNGKIAESLEETATLTTAFLTVAMSLYQALAHQQQAIKVLVKARQGTLDVMVKTTEMAKEGARAVSEQYFDPVGEMEKFRQAHQNLLEALQGLEEASKTGVIKARQSIGELNAMTSELKKKREELRAGTGFSPTPPR